MKIKTRFAPSPTGNLHIGSIRTALYSWLFARHNNGKFILRIEDTDLERSQQVSVDSIFNGLKWLGLNWDEGPYFQSQRLDRYKKVINNMIDKGDAYKCFCSSEKLEEIRKNQIQKGFKPRYPGICRNLKYKNIFNQDYVIRFKNPSTGKVVFNDKIRGNIVFDNKELDDLIIQRSNGMPTYNFCAVIDDLDMQITHVIRGEDHINNTPRQINIMKSLGAEIPIYAHLSMILDEDKHKISKRKNALSITEYYKKGFLPEALLNYIVRLGWSYGDKEIFSVLEMQELFSLKSISKSSSIISTKKLLWLNKYYINNLSVSYICNLLKIYMIEENIIISNGPNLELLFKLLRNRYHTLKEIAKSCRYFYEEFNDFNKQAAERYLLINNFSILDKLYKKIKNLIVWNHYAISEVINNLSEDTLVNIKEINMILRVAITGNVCSPSISSVIDLVGRKKTLLRIKKAMDYINHLSINKKIDN
ncbi:glutamate--tRNA ligase [Buchnera aphidicola (Brachycaudus cardui)]|uniref:Glutamate--tRNA ligase n=1 Tax=Buchnera aphidicola (Brachycaudus cardui) TaxID=557993 RepID=A0A4D6Y0U0_9GAMM|nr:glutamate--tRNA ligase [Buchnera aphidicola]QCI20228.1 glutamate--tRNA ligase [Buchnera aphidicola (Brachycaudus cardui)]